MIINIYNIMNSLGYVFFDFCGKNGFCVWLVFAYGRPALSEGRAKCVARLEAEKIILTQGVSGPCI